MEPNETKARYIGPDGQITDADVEECKRLYAANGFTGRILADTEDAEPMARELTVSPRAASGTDERMPAWKRALLAGRTVTVLAGPSVLAQTLAPTPQPQPVMVTGGARTVRQAATEQTAQAAAVERVLGTALPTPLFSLGTEMIAIGKDTYRTTVQATERLPDFRDAASDALDRIRAEHRENVVCHPKDMRVDWNGQTLLLDVKGRDHPLLFEEEGLARLATRYSRDIVSGTEHGKMDPQTLADAITWGLHHVPSDAPATTLRTRHGADFGDTRIPQVFAVVGPQFPVNADADRVLAAALQRFRGEEGLKGEITYNPVTTDLRVKAIWSAPSTLDAHVGDVFQVYWYGRTRDNGTMAFRGGGGALRILCVNCTIGGAESVDIRQIHKGAAPDFLEAVHASAARIADGFRVFADQWSALRAAPVGAYELWGQRFATVEEALTWAVESGKIEAPTKKDVMLEYMLNAYRFEPGETLADLVNAVTRAAHDGPWNMDIREELETLAGRELVPVLAGYAAAP